MEKMAKQKPLSVAMAEAKKQILDDSIRAGLPPVLMAAALREIWAVWEQEAQAQTQRELAAWKAACEEPEVEAE